MSLTVPEQKANGPFITQAAVIVFRMQKVLELL